MPTFHDSVNTKSLLAAFTNSEGSDDIQPPKGYTFNHRKDTHSTILLSECQVEHTKCPIVYYKGKGRIKEMCMCRCHSQPEPQVGIRIIESNKKKDMI